jgi:hypothetical protein
MAPTRRTRPQPPRFTGRARIDLGMLLPHEQARAVDELRTVPLRSRAELHVGDLRPYDVDVRVPSLLIHAATVSNCQVEVTGSPGAVRAWFVELGDHTRGKCRHLELVGDRP